MALMEGLAKWQSGTSGQCGISSDKNREMSAAQISGGKARACLGHSQKSFMVATVPICGGNRLSARRGRILKRGILQREIAQSECSSRPRNRLTLGETDVSCCGPFDPFPDPKAHFALQNI